MLSVVAFYLFVSYFSKHYSINTTPSMPRGIYRIVSKPITHGSIVGACIPDSFATLAAEREYLGKGRCFGNLRPVMKYVAGVSGDSVVVALEGVVVNNQPIPSTQILITDPLGRVVPNKIGKHVLKDGEIWLVSNAHKGCLDSRYFGAVTEILGVVEPLVTVDQLCKLSFLSFFIPCGG